jgi:hypothetical protein
MKQRISLHSICTRLGGISVMALAVPSFETNVLILHFNQLPMLSCDSMHDVKFSTWISLAYLIDLILIFLAR